MNRREVLALIRASFVIAIIIFFTAVAAEFSVRMYYGSTDPLVQIISGLLAVLLLTVLIVVLFLMMPDQRRALLRMFGMEEEA